MKFKLPRNEASEIPKVTISKLLIVTFIVTDDK